MKGLVGLLLLPFVLLTWLAILFHSVGLGIYDMIFGYDEDDE